MSASEGEVVTRWSILRLDSSGILRCQVKAGSEYTLADAREAIAAIAALSGGRRVPILVDMRMSRSIEREARNYFGGPEAARVQLAVALLVGSPVSRIMGNFFLSVSAPLCPTQLFSSEADALAWLQTFVER